jgi:hypothetical protein
MLYAIGEIVLVVIGILIALSINNWNEFRKDTITLRSHLLTILENISNNNLELNSLKSIRVETGLQSTYIIDKYRLGQIIDPSEYVQAHMLIAVERKFDGDISGFDLIRNSPLFDIQELKKIRDLMVEYVKLKEEIEFYEQRLNTSTETLESAMWSNGFYDKTWHYFREFVGIPNPIEEREGLNFQNLINETGAVKGFFMRAEYSMKLIIQRYDELIELADKLTEEVNLYIES